MAPVKKKSERLNRRGAVLIISMIFVLIFSALAVSMATLSGTNVQLASNQQQVNRALSASQSGLDVMRFLLADITVPVSVAPLDRLGAIATILQSKLYGAGMTNITATYDGSEMVLGNVTLCSQTGLSFTAAIRQTDPDTLQVDVTGVNRQITRTIRVNFNFTSYNPFFDYGFFGRSDIIIKSDSVVDWYNYGPNDDNFQMGTASTLPGTISIGSGATVNGDVVVGVGGDPGVVINSAGATITGDTYAMTENPELPSVTVPDWLQALPSQGSITGSITLTGSVKYDNIAIQTGDVITIDGPVILYVTGTAWLAEDKPPVFGTPMSEKGRFVINDANPDASLTMYVGGKFRVDAIVNNTFDPRRVTMYGLDSCPEWEIRTDGVFYGTVYAPNTVVELKSSVDVFGSIVAGSLVQKERGNLNFDASLRYASFDIEDLRLEFQPESYSEPSL